MIILIFIVLLILLLLTFMVSIGLCIEKCRLKQVINPENYNPFVSVIIPARNEAENLLHLLKSFENQTNSNFELILINDRSEDNSLDLMTAFKQQSNLFVKVIDNKDTPGELNPKVNVLLKGIEQAKGELFLFTDADCLAGPRWVELVINAFADDTTGIVCGLLSLTGEDTVLSRFQNFDHFYRMLYAFGLIGLGVPIGCFGNNLAIRRSTYEETGGYEELKHSATEDAELIARVKLKGNYKIRALFNNETFIETVHKKSWAEHANQASRWAAGAVFSTNRISQVGFIVLMLMVVFCLISIIPAILISNLFFLFPIIMYAFLYITAIVFGISGSVNKSYWQGMSVSVILYPFIYLQSFFRTIITRTINWKGTIITWRRKK